MHGEFDSRDHLERIEAARAELAFTEGRTAHQQAIAVCLTQVTTNLTLAGVDLGPAVCGIAVDEHRATYQAALATARDALRDAQRALNRIGDAQRAARQQVRA